MSDEWKSILRTVAWDIAASVTLLLTILIVQTRTDSTSSGFAYGATSILTILLIRRFK